MKKLIILFILISSLIIYASTDWKSLHKYLFEGNMSEIQAEHAQPRDAAIFEMSSKTGSTKLETQE